MVRIFKRECLVLFILTIFLSATVFATAYPYNQKIPILSQGKEIGYVEPYYKKGFFGGGYAYIRWQRYGFPVGDSFPIPVTENTITAPLPFGIEGEFLQLKVGKISSSSIELEITQLNLFEEIEKTGKEINKTVTEETEKIIKNINESITKEVEEITKQAQPIIEETQKELEEFNYQIEKRIQKALDRGYHSSLHILDKANINLELVSQKIMEREAELAEKIEDSVINILLESLVAPGLGLAYTIIVNQVRPEIRHDITAFLYNINSTSDNFDEDELASSGVTTIYIGNPSENKVSAQFNKQLKNQKLPYFEGNKIIGKRNYSTSDIGLVAAIPEEKYWDNTTLQQRWEKDKIRLYKTLIAGTGNDGLDTAMVWYNDQLNLAKDFFSNSIMLASGAINEDVDLNDVFSKLGGALINNPEASIGFVTIAQGWTLTAISGLQNPNFERIDSLGYVVIIKKEGNKYKTLETYSIQGERVSSFIGDYKEIVKEEGEKIIDEVGNVIENQETKITGEAIEDSKTREKKGNPIINFIKNLWRKLFG